MQHATACLSCLAHLRSLGPQPPVRCQLSRSRPAKRRNTRVKKILLPMPERKTCRLPDPPESPRPQIRVTGQSSTTAGTQASRYASRQAGRQFGREYASQPATWHGMNEMCSPKIGKRLAPARLTRPLPCPMGWRPEEAKLSCQRLSPKE